MKWFEKDDVKEKEALTPEQVDYLLQPSLTIFGPFNCLFRKQFDYLLALPILLAGSELLSLPEDIGLLSALYLVVNVFLQGWVSYFFIKHGRRLAWNRSTWKNFEAFEKSEKKWLNWTFVSFMAICMSLFQEMKKGDGATIVFGGIVVLFYGGAILLPFFQAWRMKKTKSISIPQQASPPPATPHIT